MSARILVAGRSQLGALGAALALLVLLDTGCAMQQKPSATPTAPPSKAQSEVAELEKSIADHKASLRGAEDKMAAAPAGADAASAPSAGAAPATRCDGVCRAGQEICTASRRICKLAAQHEDPPVTASCHRGERACTDASALCAQCR